MNITSMNYWYPKIVHLDVPMPKTEIPVTKDIGDWWSLLDGDDPLSEDEKQAIRDAAKRVGGYPVFMRSDLCSGKHSFERTCFVTNEEDVIRHIWAIVDENGCHDCAMESIVIRQYIPPAAAFKAFRGLPIAPERRYFVRDGEVICHHPYWESGKQWVASVIQGSAFVKEFLTCLHDLGWDAFPAECSDLAPPIHCLSGWTFDIIRRSDIFLQLYQKFGLTMLDRKKWQKDFRYIGCLRGCYIPVEKKLSVLGSGFDYCGRSASECQMEEINGVSLDLFNLDSTSKTNVALPSSTSRVFLGVDCKTPISIKDSRKVWHEVWVVFHISSHTSPVGDNILKDVVCTILKKGPIDGHTDEPNYISLLDQMNRESEEVPLLTKYAEQIAKELGGDWSVDFMMGLDKTWYMIDMAEASKSWHPPCEKWGCGL